MDSFNVIVTLKAKLQLKSYIDYVLYTLLNETASQSVYCDFEETLHRLSFTAGSLQYCDDPDLRRQKYKTIRFKKHKYVMIFRIDGMNVYVEAVYHQSQDYENTFTETL